MIWCTLNNLKILCIKNRSYKDLQIQAFKEFIKIRHYNRTIFYLNNQMSTFQQNEYAKKMIF